MGPQAFVLQILSGLACARLSLHENGVEYFLLDPPKRYAVGIIEVHDPAFYSQVLIGGTVSAGEAYMAGLWDSPDVTMVVRSWHVTWP